MRHDDPVGAGERRAGVASVSRLGRLALRRQLFSGGLLRVLMGEYGMGSFRGARPGGRLFRQHRHRGFDFSYSASLMGCRRAESRI